MPDCSQILIVVFTQQSLSRIFNHPELVTVGNFHYFSHRTGNTSIVHRNNGLCPGGDGCFNFLFIDVQGVWTNINKNRHSTTKHEGIRCGDKSEGWHNDFIPRLYITEDCCHFKGSCAGMGEQSLLTPEFFLKPLLANSGINSIPG